jgi:hypothetical protein
LQQSENIEILDYHYVIDLITQHHIPNKTFDKENINCYGAYVLDQKNKKIKKITAKVTMVLEALVMFIKTPPIQKLLQETELLLYIEPEVKFLTCNTSSFTQLQCILKETECFF